MKYYIAQKNKDVTAYAAAVKQTAAMMNIIKTFFIGLFIGIANVIPGISGGTVAVICNVYDKLIAVSSLDIQTIRQNWKEYAGLLCGLAAGVAGFARIMTILYRLYPVQTNFFFIGIILGSIPILYEKMTAALPVQCSKKKQITALLPAVLCGTAGLALVISLFLLQRSGIQTAAAVTAFSIPAALHLFCMGVLGAAAMLIPGVSGSFVLLMLGAYQTVLQAIAEMNIPLLLPLGLGVAAGLIVSARFIRFLWQHFPSIMYGFIIGLVTGSIAYLLPAVCQPLQMRFFSVLALLTGNLLVSYFSRCGGTAQQLPHKEQP